MNIKVEFNASDLYKKLNQLNKSVKDKLDKAMIEAGIDTQREAKIRVPVRTGALRNSIMVQIEKGAQGSIFVTVGAFMPYASYVEYGTRFQKAKPYLMPAYEKARKKLESRLLEIEKEIEKC